MSTLLECGHVDVGTIHSEIIVREQTEALSQRQQNFLCRADRRWKRLQFVWKEDTLCGCCGGCQFLEGVVQTSDSSIHSIFNFSRYFTHVPPTDTDVHTSISCTDNIGYIHSFHKLSSLEKLHKVLLAHYHLKMHMPIDTDFRLQSTTTTVLVNDIEMDGFSQGSDSSFVSARESLSSLNDNEQFRSVHNSPQVSEKHTKRRRKVSEYGLGYPSPRVNPKPQQSNFHSQSTAYRNMLDMYEYKMKKVKVYSTSPTESTVHRAGKFPHPVLISTKNTPYDFGTSGQLSFQHEYSRKSSYSYLLILPTIVHSQTGFVPVVVRSNPTVSMDMVTQRREVPTHYHSSPTEGKEKHQELSAFSVSLEIVGSLGMLLSPLLISVAET